MLTTKRYVAIMLYTWNLYSDVCELFLNVTGEKKEIYGKTLIVLAKYFQQSNSDAAFENYHPFNVIHLVVVMMIDQIKLLSTKPQIHESSLGAEIPAVAET